VAAAGWEEPGHGEYKDEKPVRVHTVVVSTQHDESVLKNDVFSDEAKKEIIEKVIKPVIPDNYWNKDILFPHQSDGTVRGGWAARGYGIDRAEDHRGQLWRARGAWGRGVQREGPVESGSLACYMARYIAKNIVAAGLATSAEVQLAYAIGVAQPVSVTVSTEGTSVMPEDQIAELVRKHFPLTPRASSSIWICSSPSTRRRLGTGILVVSRGRWELLVGEDGQRRTCWRGRRGSSGSRVAWTAADASWNEGAGEV
jgi:S-adenosylmethionine synthetase